MTQKQQITELNKFFSKVTYDFYNIPMAILLCFYKNKFKSMTYNDILNEIVSKRDSKKKLRKSTGEEYTGIELAIKNLLNNRKKIFKKTLDEEDNEPKYSLFLDRIQKLWEINSITMSKIKSESSTTKSQSKMNKNKYTEYDSDKNYTNYNNTKEKLRHNLLSKKTKRKNFVSDDESKDSNLLAFSIYRPKGYKANHKSIKKEESNTDLSSSGSNNTNEEEEENARSRSMNRIDESNKEEKDGYQSDDLSKNHYKKNNMGKNNSNNKIVL